MNYTMLSDAELLHYLDLESEDPVVRRLLNMLLRDTSGLYADLVSAGMDPKTFEFEIDYQSYSPGNYIRQLENDVDFYRRESDSWECKFEDMTQERDQLRARNIAKILHEMEKEVVVANNIKQETEQDLKKFKKENEMLREKLGMWNVLETE